MILRQPLAQTRRKQQLLVAITRKEVLSHRAPPVRVPRSSVATTPDDKPPLRAGVCATASQAGLFVTFGSVLDGAGNASGPLLPIAAHSTAWSKALRCGFAIRSRRLDACA